MRSRIVFLSLVLAACGSSDGEKDAPRIDAAVTCTPIAGTGLRLEEMARGLADPVFVTAPADDPRLFVVEKPGRLRILDGGRLLDTPFLDITSLVKAVGNEQGLLGLAFHPGFAENGRFYVNYTAEAPADATVVAEYTVSSNRNIASARERRLLTVPQFARNHNGGMIAFGPDGYLYIGMGDGGGGGDPQQHGQNATTLLGSLLRIDVDGGEPYGIPPGNPYAGDAAGADEVWATGLRNPWRFSFDRQTGDLYIADVGQNRLEEVSVQPAASGGGENYGWNRMEGASCFESSACDQAGLVLPVHEYDRTGDDRCSITGGYVYRGSCMPDVRGRYFFADYCTSQVWTFAYENGQATDLREVTGDLDPDGQLEAVASFGEDASGELYVVDLEGRIHRVVGE